MKLEPSAQTKWKTRPLQTSSLQSQAFPLFLLCLWVLRRAFFCTRSTLCCARMMPLFRVVRNVCLYYPINFRIWVPKPCKTAKFSNQLNVFPMSPVFVTTPFLVQKALKTANSEKCVFSCQTSKVVPEPPSSLVFRRKPAPRIRHTPNSVFCPEKPANSSPLNSSPLVTASSPLAFWVQKCATELLLRRVFRGPTVRQPAEVARQPQDTATASSIAAALLSYYTAAQVDGLLAGKLGVTEAASALQIAVRFPDDGGADEVVAAIGEQILGPTDVSLSNWTVRPSSGCSVVLATHTAGVNVDGYTLTLAANPWNIARTYNLTPGRELLFACRYRLGTASNFVVYVSEADNVYDPLYGSFAGDQGAWSTAKMYFTMPPNGVAKLHFGAHFQAPGLPNQTAGTVDVYGLQILDATLEAGNTAPSPGTLCAPTPRRYSFGCRYRLGTASNLVMYVSAADNDYVGVTGTFLGTPAQGVWSTARLDFSVLPGGVAKLHFGAFGGSIPGLVQQSAGTLDLYSMQIRATAFEGVSVTDLADSLALTGSATLDGLTAQGNVGCDQLLCNDVNCTDVFTTGVDASGAVSCAALTATGAVAGATLSSTGAVSGSSLSITGAASVGLLSSATGITGSTLTINNTANAGNFTTVGDVSTGTLTASGAATAASFAATGALTGATLTVSGAASTGPLDCESLDCTFTATSGGVSTGSVVCGDVTSSGTVSAPQLFASNTLTVTNTSDFSDDLFLTKNWAGWSKLQVSNNSAAPDSGPELRLLGNQSARVFLERDGGAHQCELIMINDEALVQTKSLSTQLSLTTNQRNPGCLVIAGNTGNVVCNTSFTDLSDSRVKTEIAEADVAELLQLFDSVEAKQYKRPDMNGDLRLGFASDDFAGTKWKNLTGTTRWSDGTEMVTLDYSHLTSVLWGGRARASRRGWTRWKPGRPSGGRRTSKHGGAEGSCRRLQRAGPP